MPQRVRTFKLQYQFFLSIFDAKPACSTVTEYTVWWVMSHQSTIGLTGLHIHGRRL